MLFGTNSGTKNGKLKNVAKVNGYETNEIGVAYKNTIEQINKKVENDLV